LSILASLQSRLSSPARVEDSRAEELAMLVTTSIEGAIIVARASRDVKPLDLVQRQLRSLLAVQMPERKAR